MWVKSPDFDRTLARLARALHNPALFRYLPIQCLPVAQIADDLEAALRQMFPDRPFHRLHPVDVDNYAHLMQRLEAAESGIVFFSDFSALLDAAVGLAAGLNQRRDRFAALPVSWICLLPTGAERLRQLQEQLPDFWAIRAGGTPELRYEWAEDAYGFFEREFPLPVPEAMSFGAKQGQAVILEKAIANLPKEENKLRANYLSQLILTQLQLSDWEKCLRRLDELEKSSELTQEDQFDPLLWRAEALKNLFQFDKALHVLDVAKVIAEDFVRGGHRQTRLKNRQKTVLLKADMLSGDLDFWRPEYIFNEYTHLDQERWMEQALYGIYLRRMGEKSGQHIAEVYRISSDQEVMQDFVQGVILDNSKLSHHIEKPNRFETAEMADEGRVHRGHDFDVKPYWDPTKNPDTPLAMLTEGFISASLGWYTEPHWWAQRARQGIIHFWGPAHPLVFETIKLDIYAEKVHFRWKSYFREKMMRKRLRGAEVFFQKMLPLYEKGYGEGGFQSFQLRFYYGSYWLVMGRYEKAEAVLAALVSDLEASGLHSPHLLALAWADLGTVSRLAWKTEAALAAHERAAAILAPLVGAAHPDRVFAEKNVELTRAQLALPERKRCWERWKGRLARLFGRSNDRLT
jgi:hypothetical protein